MGGVIWPLRGHLTRTGPTASSTEAKSEKKLVSEREGKRKREVKMNERLRKRVNDRDRA